MAVGHDRAKVSSASTHNAPHKTRTWVVKKKIVFFFNLENAGLLYCTLWLSVELMIVYCVIPWVWIRKHSEVTFFFFQKTKKLFFALLIFLFEHTHLYIAS